MGSARDGGPAFPASDRHEPGFGVEGMSLRDWFAGQALVGMISSADSPVTPQIFSAIAYEVADAMLAARNAAESAHKPADGAQGAGGVSAYSGREVGAQGRSGGGSKR